MSKISVESVRGFEALTALRPEWDALFASSNAAPFLAWEWAATWHGWFGRHKVPVIVCAREDGNLVGLLALCEDQKRVGPFMPSARRLSFLGHTFGAPDYLDVLASDAKRQRCASVIIEHLVTSESFDLLELEGLLADSLTLPALGLRFGDTADFKYQLAPFCVCPRMTLEGDWEHVLSQTRRPDYFKYCLRRLSKVGGFEFRVASSPDETPEAFARFLELHEGRWKGRGDSAATSSPELKGFMRGAVDAYAQTGRLRFEEIWLEGACRASLFGIESGEGYYFYLSGFDQAWAKYSLGFVLVGLSIRAAVERGLKYYDFLRGAENYKFDWANQTRMTVNVQIANHSRAARLSVGRSHAKELVRALLPERIKTLRRGLRGKLAVVPAGRDKTAAAEEPMLKDTAESPRIAVASR